MPQLLTVSRAARLVGVRRGALQSKIRSGELLTFEGLVSLHDLKRVYPAARFEQDAGLERIERIKDSAFAQRMRERLLPSPEALVARLTEISRERTQLRARLDRHEAIVAQLQAKLGELAQARSPDAASLLAWLEQQLSFVGHGDEPLAQQEGFLRIMTAHVQLRPSGREFLVDGNDTLLDAALRAGVSLDYGCSSGSCGKCKARVVSGQVLRTRHSDYALTATEKSAGVVLMCCHTALVDLVIEAHEAHGAADMPLQTIEARVKSIAPIAADVRLLHLQTPRGNRLRFLAGQSVSLTLPDGCAASLPVASCPCDDRNLQFHVRRRDGDDFAERVFGALKEADTVRIEGPRGAFVLDEASPRPLIFIAGDTGFAPIKSLLEHAMALDQAESLHLYWIASGAAGHYLDNLCRSWSDALDNFRYARLSADDEAAIADACREVQRDHPRLDEYDVYIAGPEPFASAMEYLLLDARLPRAQLFVNALAA